MLLINLCICSQFLLSALILLIIKLLLLLSANRCLALRLALTWHLLLQLCLLFRHLKLLFSTLSSFSNGLLTLLFSALSFNLSKSFCSFPFNSGNLLLARTLYGLLGLLLCHECSHLTILFLLLLSLLFFLEVGLQFIDRTFVFISKLLKFGAMLLILLFLARLFIFLILAKQLSHQLICFLFRVIKFGLAPLKDLGCASIFALNGNRVSRITRQIPLEHINARIFKHITENFSRLSAVFDSQVQNIVASGRFVDAVLGICAKKNSYSINIRVGADDGELKRGKVVKLLLEGPTLFHATICALN